MACWTAPSIAAIYFDTTIDDIEARIADGRLTSRLELGLRMVDVDPRPAVSFGPTFTPIEPNADEMLDEAAGLGDWRRSREAASRLRRRAA